MTATATATVRTISPEELKDALDGGEAVDVIDVRSPAEYRGVHITAARNLPLDQLDAAALKAERVGGEDRPLYVVCQSGTRSARACEALVESGIDAVSVRGGTPACEKAGLRVEREAGVISLERQVRICAGSLVVIGVLLGVIVSQWFLIVPGFVGCGLVFAGVTDFCGMGLMLARMPWNR